MKRRLLLFVVAIGGIALAGRAAAVEPAEDAYFREGELSGSLKRRAARCSTGSEQPRQPALRRLLHSR